MKTTKIAFIGAGSFTFGVGVFKDMFLLDELRGSTIHLMDVDSVKLDKMYRLVLKMNEAYKGGMTVLKTTNRGEALKGAKFVINAACIDRWELWKKDFRVPRKYGIRQTHGENGGPGGVFLAMRTLPLILDIARDMEEICPDAFLLNFSNPECRIILMLSRYTKIRSLGLCHGLMECKELRIAKYLDMPDDQIVALAAGLNHFEWVVKLWEKDTGKDLYPLLREKEPLYDPSFEPLSRKLFHNFDYYPSCNDDHIGEFLPYGWEGGEQGWDFDKTEKEGAELVQEIDDLIAGKRLFDGKWQELTGERVIQAITAILYDKNQLIESGIVVNNGVINNLPDDFAVEAPIILNADGVHPLAMGNLPEPLARLLMLQVGEQRMVVDAAVNGSKKMAMQAMLMDPIVNSTEAAERIMEELWPENEKYIRKCI